MARRGKAAVPAAGGDAQGAKDHHSPDGAATLQLTLPERFGIAEVAALRERLLALVDCPQTVVLDGGRVQQVHAAAIQLLAMFCRDRRNAQRTTQWHSPSSMLTYAAGLLGANPVLQLA